MAVHTTIAKITATPTEKNWSHAYSAGNLLAVVSLAKKDKEVESSLNVVGKGIINNLEAEFFTLEEKNLASIKQAIANAVESMPDGVILDLALAYSRDDVLYLFAIGKASILLRRGGKIATILQKSEESKDKAIAASSGFLKARDTLVLQTHQFQKVASEEDVASALAKHESIQQASEALSPAVDDAPDGGAAAIFLTVSGSDEIDSVAETPETTEEVVPAPLEEKAQEEETIADEPQPDIVPIPDEKEPVETEAAMPPALTDESEPERSASESHENDHEPIDALEPEQHPDNNTTRQGGISFPKFQLGHKRKVILSIAVILLLVLGFSVYSAIRNQQESKEQALFTEMYNAAKKDYEEGEDLVSLNENVARDDFMSAQKRLLEAQKEFKEGSPEREQIDALLAKVEARLGNSDDAAPVEAKAVNEDESELLKTQIDENTSFVAKGDNGMYVATDDAITRVTNGKETEVYENDDDWSSVKGIGTFGSNVYLLDADEGVLKFAAGSGGYGKAGYFAGEVPDMTSAVDMAIDGSVYVLFKNGDIKKYTRGKADSFKVDGMQKPFSSAKRIYTEEDFDNVYVLDNGNNRVVVLSKDGEFVKEYKADILKNATGIEVSEADKKIYILAQKRVYALDME